MTQDTEDVVALRIAEIRHWFFQTLTPEQRSGFFYAWAGVPKDVPLALGTQYQSLEHIARAALEASDRQSLSDRIDGLEAEAVELRAERDSLLQKPIDLAKLDSIDEDASGKMVAYYWWQQAQDARAALHQEGIAP